MRDVSAEAVCETVHKTSLPKLYGAFFILRLCGMWKTWGPAMADAHWWRGELAAVVSGVLDYLGDVADV